MSAIPGIDVIPNRAKEILDKFSDPDEICLECAKWTVDIIHEFKYLPCPAKPRAVLDFEDISVIEKEKLGEEYFRANPEIRSYYEKKRRAEQVNAEHTRWLRECRLILMKAGLTKEGRIITDKLESEGIICQTQQPMNDELQ